MKPNDELALKILRFVSSTLLVVLSVVCANAQSRQTILQCNYMIAGVSPDTQISACNQLLSSKMRLSAQDLAGLHVMLGQGYYRKNDATKALIEFDEALKSKPSRPATTLGLGLRGVVHKSRGELDLALKDFNEALNLDPRNAPTMADRGSAYMEKRDYKRAMTDFDMALQLNPKMALTHLMRSNLYTIEGDDERADSDLKLAISLDPKRREDFIGKRPVQLGRVDDKHGARPHFAGRQARGCQQRSKQRNQSTNPGEHDNHSIGYTHNTNEISGNVAHDCAIENTTREGAHR